MESFYLKLAEIMDVDEVQADSVLRDFAEWDSLTALSVVAMVHSKYGVTLSGEDLRQASTAQALYEITERKRKS